MGVPGFFMWLWKRYKGNNFVFKKSSLDKDEDKSLIKRIDNIDFLLIDTNCLLHPMCFQVLAEEQEKLRKLMKNTKVDIEKLEDKMMARCFEYIDKLIEDVQPKEGVYIAIDGVAPLAKIKQQRSRRFKSVCDRNLRENLKRKHNKELDFFWNNSAITPGTEFMERLHLKMIAYSKKVEAEKNIKFIYSSCKTPSEGEHKLLQYIRDNMDKSYVIYGLDADLVFLSLASGHNNTFLLREGVHLKNGDMNTLCYVDMEKVKESIVDTIGDIIDTILDEKPLDIEIKMSKKNIVNDFVFICYFLGNDFLPHLEALNIVHGGLDFILKKYSELFIDNIMNSKSKYIINKNYDDMINYKNLFVFIKMLAKEEDGMLQLNYGSGKRRFGCRSSDPYEKELFRIERLMFKIDDPVALGSDNYEEYRKRYYSHYYNTNDDELDEYTRKQVYHYMRGIKWTTMYYFDKCPDWRWYYPYNHPPFIKDMVKHFKKINFSKISFDIHEPLEPLIQLLNVLPPQSSYLIPRNIRFLVTNSKSPLIHMYPLKFEQDFINKGMYWKSIPILPEVDLYLVLKSFNKYKVKLDKEELKRNERIDLQL